jgi:hypothetical protein
MKNLKKIGAIILAVMMMAMVATAWAADGDTPNSNYNGTAEGDTALAVRTSATEFAITKDIVLYNAEGSSIYTPNVTYSYSVAPVGNTDTKPSITGIVLDDQTNPGHTTTTVTVRNGISGGVLLANAQGGTGAATTTIAFTNGDALDAATPLTEGTAATTSNATAAKTSKNLYIQINPATIYNNGANPAGVYRYAIIDTTERATLAAAGILRNDDYDASYKTLYLDVYLKNTVDNSGAVTGLEVYGYVLSKGTEDNGFQYVSGSTESYKLTGFNVASELSGTNVISDQYHTYNLNVTKTTTGSMADKNHYFPFDITLTEAASNTATKVYVTYANAQDVKDGSETAINTATGTTLSAGATATSFTGKIKNGGNIKFTGIPSYITYDATTKNYDSTVYATANAKETNNTQDTYSATATVDGETTTNVQLSYKATSSANAADTTATAHSAVISSTGDATLKAALTVDGKNTSSAVVLNSIDFTNTLEAISPTGYVARFAPYALILIGGIALLIIAKKHKRHTDEE